MHIPDGFLEPRVWVPLDVISGSLVVCGLRKTSKTLEEKAVPLMGVVAAFVFAAQMLNIPVAGGTSAHFLGGALVGALLGPWSGLVVMSVVLIVQCFLFQDGGAAALGANIFNMGVIGAFLGAFFFRWGIRIIPGRRRLFWAGFLSGWVSMILSAISCAGQLVLSKVTTATIAFSLVVGIHAFLGILEGVVTGTVLEALGKTRPDLLKL